MRSVVLAPEAVVLAAAVAFQIWPRLMRGPRTRLEPAAALGAALAALGLELWLGVTVGTLFAGGWVQDRFSLFAKAALLVGLVTLVAVADAEDEAADGIRSMAFLAVFGGMVAASAGSLVGLWAGLELTALAGIGAVAMAAPSDRPSGPGGNGLAGRRLLLVSTVAGGLIAFGFAFLYAVAGSADLTLLRSSLLRQETTIPLAMAALILLTGLALRLGLAPFQAPVTEGSIEPRTAAAGVVGGLMAGAAVIVAARLLGDLVGVNGAWAPWISVLAASAMIVGGLRALVVSSFRAQAAWLALHQLGWVAAGLAAHDRRASSAALFLLAALIIGGVAAPALAAGTDLADGPGHSSPRDPLRSAGLALVLLSLAGVPPLAGFFGEFTVAVELIRSGMAWVLAAGLLGAILAVAGAARSLGSLYLPAAPAERGLGVRGGRYAQAVSLGPLVPAVLIVAYGAFSYPIHTLAVQGAAALGLR